MEVKKVSASKVITINPPSVMSKVKLTSGYYIDKTDLLQ